MISQTISELSNIDNDKIIRESASTIMAEMKVRIHRDGLDANNSQIGTYSKGYLAIRSGQFKNSGRYSRGKNQGKVKDSGVYTKGRNKGSVRIKYNRGNDPKVILSLTRQMEGDMIIIPIQGGYGIGYTNEANYNKAMRNEKRYKRQIFALSENELQIIDSTINEYLK